MPYLDPSFSAPLLQSYVPNEELWFAVIHYPCIAVDGAYFQKTGYLVLNDRNPYYQRVLQIVEVCEWWGSTTWKQVDHVLERMSLVGLLDGGLDICGATLGCRCFCYNREDAGKLTRRAVKSAIDRQWGCWGQRAQVEAYLEVQARLDLELQDLLEEQVNAEAEAALLDPVGAQERFEREFEAFIELVDKERAAQSEGYELV